MSIKNFLLLSIVIAPTLLNTAHAAETDKIVILGAGMSGLAAAHTLKKSLSVLGNVHAEIEMYEGRDRLGGRTNTHYFNDEKTIFYEEGGTFIDSDHTEAIGLAEELGVQLVKRGFGSRKITAIHNNKPQDYSTLYTELGHTKQKLEKQLRDISGSNTWLNLNSNTSQWHYNPLTPHLASLSPLGRSFIQRHYEYETGSSIDKAPCFALSWLAKSTGEYAALLKMKDNFSVPNLEIDQLAYNYTVQGGMSTFVSKLSDSLAPHININLSHKLSRIKKEDGRYRLTFKTNEGKKYVTADKLIITLPFSTLRDVKIDDSVGLSDFQQKAIKELPYGTNSKIGIPVVSSKKIYDDMLYYLNLDDRLIGWPGENALTLMVNAENGENLDHVTASDIAAQQYNFVTSQHPSIKGFGDVVVKNWAQDPLAKGSYSTSTTDVQHDLCYPHEDKVQFPGMRKFAEPVNKSIFFAGEHTRSDYPAYIEGAVRSGKTAVEMLIQLILKGQLDQKSSS